MLILRRLSFLISLYHLVLLAILWGLFGHIFYQSVLIIGIAFVVGFFSKKIACHKLSVIYFSFALLVFILMWFHYDLVGHVNRATGWFKLKDQTFLFWDHRLWGECVAEFWRNQFQLFGDLIPFCYDFLLLCYISYYLLPYYGIFHFYQYHQKNGKSHPLLPTYLLSMVLLLLTSYSTYFMIPVTGPQYFWVPFLQSQLPFTPIGHFVHQTIAHFQSNLIDCFPSVHSGLSILVAVNMIHAKFRSGPYLILLSLLIVLATVVLRFHYSIDVFFALFYVLGSYFIAIKCRKFLISEHLWP